MKSSQGSYCLSASTSAQLHGGPSVPSFLGLTSSTKQTPPPNIADLETLLTKKQARGDSSKKNKCPSCRSRILQEATSTDSHFRQALQLRRLRSLKMTALVSTSRQQELLL